MNGNDDPDWSEDEWEEEDVGFAIDATEPPPGPGAAALAKLAEEERKLGLQDPAEDPLALLRAALPSRTARGSAAPEAACVPAPPSPVAGPGLGAPAEDEAKIDAVLSDHAAQPAEQPATEPISVEAEVPVAELPPLKRPRLEEPSALLTGDDVSNGSIIRVTS